ANAQAESADSSDGAIRHQESESDQDVDEPDHHRQLCPAETPRPIRKATAEGLNRHKNCDGEAQQGDPRPSQHKAGEGSCGPGIRPEPGAAVPVEETPNEHEDPGCHPIIWPSVSSLRA